MGNPNLLDKLFQYIHHPLWYRNPPTQYQDPPPSPQNMDLDGSFEVDFQWLRRWATLKAYQTTPLFVERTPLIVHWVNLITFILTIYNSVPSPTWSSCHGRNLTWLWYQLMQRRHVEAESITHKYCNSSTKPKFYKNTRLIGK